MLREATPEVIRSSVGVGDGAQASSPLAEDAWSSPVSCYMGDGDGGDDNLSIELNSLFAMLDGHPDSSVSPTPLLLFSFKRRVNPHNF